MRATYQQTSLFAYITAEGLPASRRKVYEAIKRLGSATNNMIANATGLQINRVTPRCQEFRNAGLVEESHRGTDVTGRTAIFWRTK